MKFVFRLLCWLGWHFWKHDTLWSNWRDCRHCDRSQIRYRDIGGVPGKWRTKR